MMVNQYFKILGLYKLKFDNPDYDDIEEIVYIAYDEVDYLDLVLNNDFDGTPYTLKEYIEKAEYRKIFSIERVGTILTAKTLPRVPYIVSTSWIES